jgi:hypothetical protein
LLQKHSLSELKARGLPQAEMDAKIKEMDYFREMYKNPLIKIGLTYLEIFPLGLVITLLCAAILKRKDSAPKAVLV